MADRSCTLTAGACPPLLCNSKARKPTLTQGVEQSNDGNAPVSHLANDTTTAFASVTTSTIHTGSYRNTQNSSLSKISPSSIPNPNPSASTTKQNDTYPTYGGYLYSIPGYSAFQPLQYSNLNIISQSGNTTIPLTSMASEPLKTTDYIQLTSSSSTTSSADVQQEPQNNKETALLSFKQEENVQLKSLEIFDEANDKTTLKTENIGTKIDFEDQFTTEFISPHSGRSQSSETKDPSPTHKTALHNTNPLLKCEPSTIKTSSSVKTKSKQTERFSLKTSIPISKIDMKCVSTPPDSLFQSMFLTKVEPKVAPTSNSTANNPSVAINSSENLQKITIQSNILLRGTPNVSIQNSQTSDKKLPEETTSICTLDPPTLMKSNSIDPSGWTNDSTCDAMNNTGTNSDLQTNQTSNAGRKQSLIRNDAIESIEPKKQIVFIPKRPNNSQQLLLAISQAPTNTNQLIVKRNITPEPKNIQVPSRLSQNSSKKGKDSLLLPEPVPTPANKVVALKRLHQDNGDENDFENLITENQIYGNKIVVKEKTQNNQNIVAQGHETKANDSAIIKIENESDPPSIYLHPNFLYLNNIQFRPQFMMMNSAKITNNSTINDRDKEDKNIDSNVDEQPTIDVPTSQGCIVRNFSSNQNVITLNSNDVALMKPTNAVIQSSPAQSTSSNDDVIQQNCSTNPQLIYHLPMVIDPNITVKSVNSSKHAIVTNEFNVIMKSPNNFETRDGSNKSSNIEIDKVTINSSSSEELFIACPFQGEKSSQPKIFMTNIKTKPQDTEIISTIDMAEKRKRLRRLKHLAKRDPSKAETGKQKSADKSESNIISPFDIKLEIEKEFMDVKLRKDLYAIDSESDTEDAVDYNKIAELCNRQVGTVPLLPGKRKVNFMKTFGLTTKHDYREKEIEKLEKSLQMDSVASACISVGRLDWIHKTSNVKAEPVPETISNKFTLSISCAANPSKGKRDSRKNAGSKFKFLAQLNLTGVSRNLRDEYETIWQKVIEDRKKRSGETAFTKYCDDFNNYNRIRTDDAKSNIDCHTQGQLKFMTQIKKSVNKNNKLIKQRLDGNGENSSSPGEDKNSDINLLADINLSELCKLSKMADKSVKMLSGQEVNKPLSTNETARTPTERNIDKTHDQNSLLKNVKTEYPLNESSYSPKRTENPKISIPNVSKIISLKSLHDPSVADTSPATSMDEPQNSAAGAKMENSYIPPSARIPEDCTPFAMQANYLNYGFNAFSGCYDGFYRKHNMFEWPGVDAIVASYRRYDAASSQEQLALYTENLHLKHELAARQSEAAVINDSLRQDVANKQSIEMQEAELRGKIQRLHDCMDVIKSIS